MEEYEFKLSIGMIVKNEEKYMRACLNSLKPILDNVSSELVIVDTGSTDGTIEIAREYTDKIYSFEWVNDFSAARNFGLLKCVGEWFMYTDADTIFDTSEKNMQPMIDFFNDYEINRKYLSATYVTRNYSNPSHTDYSEHREFRITRRTPKLRFIYAIHEVFNCQSDRICFLDTFAHHYGYSFANLAEATAKSKRNCTLLKKELEKNPRDLRLQCMLFDSLIEHDDKVKTIENALSQARTSNQVFAPVTFVRAVRFFSDFDTGRALECAEEYISRTEDDATLVDVYYKAGVIKENLHDYTGALEMFKKCYDHQKLYKEGKLNMMRTAFVTLSCIGKGAEAETFRHIVFCMANIDKAEKAVKLWQKEHTQFSFTIAVSILNNIILVSKDYSPLCGVYESIDDEAKRKSFEVFLEQLYYKSDDKQAFAEELGKGKGDFAELMRLVRTSHSGGFGESMKGFLHRFVWRDGFSEIIYLMLANGLDIRPVIAGLNYNQIRTAIDKVSQNHSDFSEMLYNHCSPVDFTNSMTEVLWLTCALESVVFKAKNIAKEDVRLGIYKNYANILAICVANTYNSALLNDADISVLPELHRLGYFMMLAQGKLENGDKVGYVRELKNGLLQCECAKDIVTALVDDLLS